jgi:recombining binding protein suppressor of hairless
MIGNSWWTDVVRRGEDPKLCPPRVVISISGEPSPQEGSIEWTGSSGKPFDVADPPTGTTYVGRCVGKQLFISDVDEKKKKVEALVKITAPASDEEPERVIGVFPSRPIKVISKPSKKRQSAKNLERQFSQHSFLRFFLLKRTQCALIMGRQSPCFIVCDRKLFLPSIFVYLAPALHLKVLMVRP